MSGETRTARHVGTVHFCPHLAPTSILNGSAVPPGTYSSAVRPPEQAEGVHDPCVTTDLNTLLTALYVKIDDEIGQVRCSGRPPLLSDSELVCLAVAQALLGFHSEARWLRYARKHLTGMFPHLPQRPGYHKRLKAALPLLKRMIRELAMDSDFWTDTVWIAVSILRIATEEAFAPPELIAMWRVVCMHAATVRAQRYEAMKPIRRKPSEYLRENVWVTTSGVAWARRSCSAARRSALTACCTPWITRTSTSRRRLRRTRTCRSPRKRKPVSSRRTLSASSGSSFACRLVS